MLNVIGNNSFQYWKLFHRRPRAVKSPETVTGDSGI